MSTKTVFVILWLTFFSFLSAQAPERTKPAQEVVGDWGVQTPPSPAVKQQPVPQLRSLPTPPPMEDSNRQSMIPPGLREKKQESFELESLKQELELIKSQVARYKVIDLRAQELRLRKKIADEEKKRRREEDEADKKAREEMERKEKQEREYKEALILARANAQINGCSDVVFSKYQPPDLELGQMWVDTDATTLSNSKLRGTIFSRQWIQLRIISDPRGPLMDIEVNDRILNGVVVKNLCPGGRITLFRERSPVNDGNQMTFSVKAIRSTDGRVMETSYYLSVWDLDRGKFPTWTIPNW